MHLRVSLIIIFLSLSSCNSIDNDRQTQVFTTGIRQVGELARASVQYRLQLRTWPAEPTDLQPLIVDRSVDFKHMQETLRFKPEPRGLAFVDRRSGKTALLIAAESTPNHVVLLGGE